MSKYADIEQIKKVIRTEWVRYMPTELDVNLSFVLGKISEVPTIEVSEDCISREYMKSLGYINKGDFNSVETIREWIDNAPSVVPSRAEGAWITACNSYEIICSNCESEAFSEDGEYVKTNFCPNCGARMRG